MNTIESKEKAVAILKKNGKVKLINIYGETKVVNNRQSLNNLFKLGDYLNEQIIDAEEVK